MGRDSHRTASRRINRAVCEALENRVLLSNPIVLEPLPREQRDNYIAPTSYSPTLAAPPEHFEWEYDEQRLVYRFDQPVSGLGDGVSNQNHVLTSLYQVVQVENPAYPLDDVPLTVWTGPFGTERHTLLLDSTDGLNWTGSNGDVTATLIPQQYSIWQHRLTVATPTGSVTWRMSWNGYNGAGYISPDAGSVSGDGADYYIESFGTPRFTNSHVGGNVVQGLPTPTTSDNLTFIIPTALPNGYYDAVLSSLGITNIAGEHLDGVDGFFDGDGDGLDDPGDYVYSLFVLAGDANHDRVINITDFGVIDANVGQSGSVFGFFNGDFNYDGKINVDDYGVIDSNYATQLPAPLTGANQLSASAAYEVPGIANSIRLQWTAPEGATDIDSWGLWRSIDGGVTFTLLTDDIPGTARSWDDIGDGQGLPEGSKFTYRLRAFSDELGYSETTNKAWSVTNLPGPITATITDITTTSMTLNWTDRAANEHGYEIWQEGVGPSPVLVATLPSGSGEMSYTLTDLFPNTEYFFRVHAHTDATGSLPASATARTVNGPALLTSSLIGPTSLALSWLQNDNQSGFELESSTDGVDFTRIAEPAPGSWNHSLSGLIPDTPYTFRLRSVGASTSPWISIEVRTLPTGVPIAPSGVSVSVIKASRAEVDWVDNSNDETGFTVQRRTGNASWDTLGATAPDQTAWSDVTIEAETEYEYRVLASGVGGSSTSAASTVDIPAKDVDEVLADAKFGAEPTSTGEIKLSWSGVAARMQLEVKEPADENFRLVGELDAAPGRHTQIYVARPHTSYQFRLRVDKQGLVRYKAVRATTTDPDDPTTNVTHPPPRIIKMSDPGEPLVRRFFFDGYAGADYANAYLEIDLRYADDPYNARWFPFLSDGNVHNDLTEEGPFYFHQLVDPMGEDLLIRARVIDAAPDGGASKWGDWYTFHPGGDPLAAPELGVSPNQGIETMLDLAWEGVPDGRLVKVWRVDDPAGNASVFAGQKFSAGSADSMAVVKGPPGSCFFITYDQGFQSPYSNFVAGDGIEAVPAAPANLSAVVVPYSDGGHAVRMLWDNVPNNESGFEVERATDPEFTKNLRTFQSQSDRPYLQNDFSFEELQQAAWSTLYYRVRANGDVNSDWSNVTTINLRSKPLLHFIHRDTINERGPMTFNDLTMSEFVRFDWQFYGHEEMLDRLNAVLTISVMARAEIKEMNPLPGVNKPIVVTQIPKTSFKVAISAKQYVDPDDQQAKWQVNVAPPQFTEPLEAPRLGAGVGVVVTGEAKEKRLAVTWDAGYSYKGPRLMGIPWLSWVVNADHPKTKTASWTVRVSQPRVLE